MKAAVFVKPGQMEVKEFPKPKIEKPTDAVIKVLRTCVCGSEGYCAPQRWHDGRP